MLLGAHLLQRLSACHRAKVHLILRKTNVSIIPTFTLSFEFESCVFAPHPIPTCLFSAIQVCSIVRGEDYKRGSGPSQSRLPHLVQDLPNRIVELPQGVPIVRGSIEEMSQDSSLRKRTCCSIREIQARSTTVRGWSQEPSRGNMATSHLSSR